MRIINIIRYGSTPVDCLAVRYCSSLVPGPGEVRVKIYARPINPADLMLIQGRHVYRPPLPCPVGIEGAGVVDAVGPGSCFSPGDLVAIHSGGTWCDQLITADDNLILLPPGSDLCLASMLSVNPFTASGLLDGLQEGCSVLLNAAQSSVGRMIVVLAKQRGLQVVCLVRSEHQRQALVDLGADHVFIDDDTLEESWRTAGLVAVDRALDALSGDASSRLFDHVADGGELVVYGLLTSDQIHLPAASLVFRDVRVRGFSRLRSLRQLTLPQRQAAAEELLSLMVSGVLQCSIESRYPLDQVVSAVEHQMRADRVGKILLIDD